MPGTHQPQENHGFSVHLAGIEEIAEAAKTRGRELDVWATAEDLLIEVTAG